MGKAVKQEYADDPRTPGKKVWVSTVRLSVDHGYDGVPKWYETFIFPAKDDASGVETMLEEWGVRYTTEKEAIFGHVAVVASLEKGEWPE